MEGKGKRIMEEGESSTHPYKRTARISRRTYVTEWLQRMDDSDLADPSLVDEATAPIVQPETSSDQFALEIDKPGLKQEISDPLKLEPAEGDLPLLQADQLQQEMSWMGEFNKNTLGNQETLLQPDQSEDSDPLKYLQEPLDESINEKLEGDSEEDPEERPQDEEPVKERNGENQEEPGEEPANDGVGADEDEEVENDAEQPVDDDENDEPPSDEDDQQVNEDEPENEQEDEDEEQSDDDEEEEGEAANEDMGTVSPASTITTV